MKSQVPADPIRALLIEDEAVICELVQSLLAEERVDLTCTGSGLEGVRLALQQRFDVVLLDVVLPQVDGLSICRILRAEPATSKLPIYMLTAKTLRSDVEAAKRAGASGYIRKPFKSDDLVSIIRAIREEAARP